MEGHQKVKGITVRWHRLDSEQLTMIICTAVVFLAQISENNNSSMVMLVGYLIALLWSLVCNSAMLMAMNLFFLSDNSLLDIGGVSIQLIIMCVYLIKFVVLKKKKLYAKTFVFGIFISIYSIIYINRGMGYVLQGVKLATMIIFMTEYFLEKESLTKENYIKQLSFAVMGVFISVVAAICVNPSILLSSRIALSEDSNWNLLGILSALLFSHSFMMLFVTKSNEKKYIAYSIIMAGCALISTSRTALALIIGGTIWILLFVNQNGTIARKCIVLFAIIIFLILLANGTIQISYVDKLIDRIINPRRGDISNGRFALWTGYIEYLKTHTEILWLGYGGTLIEGITTQTSSISNMAHNMLIEQITMYGIIGTILVLLLYISSAVRIRRSVNDVLKKCKIKYAVCIILVFAAGMVSHIITSVLVTTELYLGIMQFYVLSMKGNK